MALSRYRLRRLEGRLSGPVPAPVEIAVRLMTDRELEHLDSALNRGFDPHRDRQDVLEDLSPAEQMAFKRFQVLYEEACRGG